MELMYNFNKLVLRRAEESIQKRSNSGLNSEKMSAPSKRIISFEIDGSKNFFKAGGIGKNLDR